MEGPQWAVRRQGQLQAMCLASSLSYPAVASAEAPLAKVGSIFRPEANMLSRYSSHYKGPDLRLLR